MSRLLLRVNDRVRKEAKRRSAACRKCARRRCFSDRHPNEDRWIVRLLLFLRHRSSWLEHVPSKHIGPKLIARQCAYLMSVTRAMSGFGSTRSVRFSPEGSHAAGGQNGPDHRCDWAASSEEVELRGGGGAVGHERASFSPAARRL